MLLDQVVVDIHGLCMFGNYADESGGGIYSFGSFISLWSGKDEELNCSDIGRGYSAVVTRNGASIGGSLYISKTFLTSKTDMLFRQDQGADFLFSESSSFADGGGIACIGSDFYAEKVTILQNVAGYQSSIKKGSGGGLYGVLCNLELVDAIIKSNKARSNGAGIFLESLSGASILKTRIEGNYADGTGGGIYAEYMEVLKLGDGSVLTYNNAAFGGGSTLRMPGRPQSFNFVLLSTILHETEEVVAFYGSEHLLTLANMCASRVTKQIMATILQVE